MTFSENRIIINTVESQSRLNEREVINLENNKYIMFNDDENTTISEDTLNKIADNCIALIKQELISNDKPCTFEICQEISDRIKRRIYIQVF